MSKGEVKSVVTFPNAGNDFYKTNGTVHLVMPGGPSLTRQEFAEECDINSIMKRYETAGATINGLPRMSDVPPFYADFTTMPTTLLDYMSMMQDAEVAFMSLPAVVRREFDNSPHAFVDFASDPGNVDQMRAWGLAPPAKPQEPVPNDPPAPVGAPPVSPGGSPAVAPAGPVAKRPAPS